MVEMCQSEELATEQMGQMREQKKLARERITLKNAGKNEDWRDKSEAESVAQSATHADAEVTSSSVGLC